MVRYLIKLVISFFVMTVVCTIGWELFVDNHIYRCTDPGFLDYLSPGDWVHAHDGLEIKVVPQIVADGDMVLPDTIKEGWTVGRLWVLWYSLMAFSIVTSVFSASRRWMPRRKHEL